MLREAKGLVSLGAHHRLGGRNVSLFDNQKLAAVRTCGVGFVRKYGAGLYVEYVKYAAGLYEMYVKYVEVEGVNHHFP